MKTFINLIALTALVVAAAQADINITLDNAAQSGVPGSTLQFFGTISNTGSDTVFLNSDSLNLAGGSDFTTNDLFFTNVPVLVAANSSSGDIELFDATVSNPFADTLTTYNGTYTVIGGVDGGAQDVLAEAAFSVNVTNATPEPGYFALLGIGLALMTWLHRRRAQNQ